VLVRESLMRQVIANLVSNAFQVGSSHPLRVVLLGSSQFLMQQGVSESLAGRFELICVPHWSFAEMRDAFG